MTEAYSVFTDRDNNDYEMRWYGGQYVSIHDESTKDEIGCFSLPEGKNTYSNIFKQVSYLFDNPHLINQYLS